VDEYDYPSLNKNVARATKDRGHRRLRFKASATSGASSRSGRPVQLDGRWLIALDDAMSPD
jgi:hypothetical protein